MAVDVRNEESYIFVIDTEQYAGNFERELCAYMTGAVADCGVGMEWARDWYINVAGQEWMKEAQYNSYDLVTGAEDWNGFTNIQKEPDEHGFPRPCGIVPTPGWFNNGIGGHFKDGDEEAAKEHWEINTERNYAFYKHPAYNSVGIFFEEPPSDEQVAIMIPRAREYAEKNDITITGFRLIKKSITFNELETEYGGKN